MPRIKKPQQNNSRSSSNSSNSQSSETESQPQPQNQPQAPPTQPLHKLSPTLQTSYTRLKQSQQSQSLLLTQQTTKVLIHLKQLYLEEQSAIVKGIKEMAQESKAIIQDLTNIETQIDKYHDHIELWIKKIQETGPAVEKIRNVEEGFRKKAANFAKLKDFLNVQRPKRR